MVRWAEWRARRYASDVFNDLRQDVRAFSGAGPGSRFVERRQRRAGASRMQRVIALALGSVLFVAGILMLVFPGPGVIGMLLGLALMSGESAGAARLLDRLDVVGHRVVRAVKRRWRAQSKPMRIITAVLFFGAGAAFTAAFTYLTWRYGGSLV